MSEQVLAGSGAASRKPSAVARLGALVPLGLHQRAELILCEISHDMVPAPHAADCDGRLRWRAAWAVGHNLATASQAASERQVTYLEKFGDGITVQELLLKLKVDDLFWSVAIEERGDWQPDECRPINLEAARNAFAAAYKLYDGKVRRNAFVNDVAVTDAWGRVYETYWHRSAKSRFLAINSIPGMVRLIARNVAAAERTQDERDDLIGERAEVARLLRIDPNSPPLSPMEIEEERAQQGEFINALRKIAKCHLTNRQYLIVVLMLKGRTKASIRQILKRSPPYVPTQLAEARKRLRDAGVLPDWIIDEFFS